jgi:hypothetical protein
MRGPWIIRCCTPCAHALVGLLLLLPGCSALLDLNLDFSRDSGANEDVEETDPIDPTGCVMGSKRPPPRPPASTEAASIPELLFMLKDVVLSDPTAAINVDRTCTSIGGPWTCLPPPELERYLAGQSFAVPPDGLQGEENQFAREVYPIINVFFATDEGDLEATAHLSQGSGVGSPVIRIREYNGAANDPRVTVIVTQSVFAVAGEPGATTSPEVCIVEDPLRGAVPHVPHLEDGGGACLGEEIPPLPVEREYDENGFVVGVASYDPAWDEGTLWTWVRSDTFAEGNEAWPLVVDEAAYVSDWTLVARMPDNVEFKLVGDGQAVVAKWTDAFAIAKLKEDLSGTEPHDVLVAGRWSKTAMLETAQAVGVCPGDPAYLVGSNVLDAKLDVRSNREDEGLDVRCDAVSFALTHTAHRANFGGIALGQPVPNACGD